MINPNSDVDIIDAKGVWKRYDAGKHKIEALRGLDLKGRPREARQKHQEVVTYFTNQAHRMDYPAYRAKGYSFGSRASRCSFIGVP